MMVRTYPDRAEAEQNLKPREIVTTRGSRFINVNCPVIGLMTKFGKIEAVSDDLELLVVDQKEFKRWNESDMWYHKRDVIDWADLNS